VEYKKITRKGLFISTKESAEAMIEADSIVCIGSAKPNTELYNAVEGKAPEVFIIGDSNKPQGIMEAISDGFRIAREI
jgi:2,4-dienoyl-CoA reductase (NADPH2)